MLGVIGQLLVFCLRMAHVFLRAQSFARIRVGVKDAVRLFSVSRGSDLFLGISSRCERKISQSKYHKAIMDSSMDSKRYAPENEPELSPLEQEVLDEYAKLVGNLDNVHLLNFSLNSSTNILIHDYSSPES